MSEEFESMPYNEVGTGEPESIADIAEREGITEEQWRAENLPHEDLIFRWRYTDGELPLYERRIRSLRAFNIGPAVQAWVRSRLEWTCDNKLRELPDGVLVMKIDTEGLLEIELEPVGLAPAFDHDNLIWCQGTLLTSTHFKTLWVARGKELTPLPSTICHAADTLVRDLAKTLGYEVTDRPVPKEDFFDMECFVVADEFGVIPCSDLHGATTHKMMECFNKLWPAPQIATDNPDSSSSSCGCGCDHDHE